ncbi:MAG: RNA-binding protein [Candidatus Pacebacteria bacterium]|nr:RNA-binding protein [Candidatus Paceibacterota bacterium]MBP9770174.1 RNA-binding protein [Candidatus Paceibacterota bacterium]
MAVKLYVGNLSYKTDESSLTNAFSAFGSVASAKIITDKMTGRPRGFGFVEMSSEEEANKAIDGMNGKDFDGRTLNVNIARPMEDRR